MKMHLRPLRHTSRQSLVAPPSRQASPAEKTVLPQLMARRVVEGVGHFMPRERPGVVSMALLELLRASR